MHTRTARWEWIRQLGRRAILASALVPIAPVAILAQPTTATDPRVFLRHLRLDPLLVASGLDSTRLHGAVEEVLRKAARLSEGTDTVTIPALDIDLGVPRGLTGTPPDPQALLHVEVGRNRMETGKATAVVWERTVTLPEYPTWRGLSAAAPQAVIDAVLCFVRDRVPHRRCS